MKKVRNPIIISVAISVAVIMSAILVWTLSSAVAQSRSGKRGIAKPQHVFAPYVDVVKESPDLRQLAAGSGARTFILGFVTSREGCKPAWGESPAAGETAIKSAIQDLRGMGGDAIIAFGGYDGRELALACPDVNSLRDAYQSVVNLYRPRTLDFDLEREALTDQPSIDRRNEALRQLAAANPGLQIIFTLPSTPDGLTPHGLDLLRNAVEHRTPVTIVNLMAMDFGGSAEDGSMGEYAISDTMTALDQIRRLGLPSRLGVTAMIGKNDTQGQTFTLDDAEKLVSWAHTHPIVLLSFWSLGRDNGNCSGVSPSCSGIAQQPWAFSRVFSKFQTSTRR